MDVGAHPHIGLQTVSWLLDGEIAHYDSLGNDAALAAGGVNVMTAGEAITHAERTPGSNSGRLDGVQLWTALPHAHRGDKASFQHVAEVPVVVRPGGSVRVFAGTLDGVTSPAVHYSDILGADIEIHPGETIVVPLEAGREHGVLLLRGDAELDAQRLTGDFLYYLETGRVEARFRSGGGARVLLLGGRPFSEEILMWWNFVARTRDEIKAARLDWEDRRRFGEVLGYHGPRLAAPDLLRLAEPNPMS